nr:hypothetical protein [Oscillospiraceae bacterium]
MLFQTEAGERYSVFQNRAKQIVRKGIASGMEVTLPVLDTVVDRTRVAGEVDLGVLNIPVNQIVGIVSDSDTDTYTSDFLPLPSVTSGYAETWVRLYMEHLSGTDLAEPIRCYEYLGKFYVSDGKKRVSVLKADGAMMVKASVTRILPVKTDDPQILSYYEFVKTFEKTGLYQIAFTQPGNADSFLKALGYNPDHVWNENDRNSFAFYWYPFEQALIRAFDGVLTITTADALMVLLKNHSYAQLREMPSWTLAELMQEAWPEMYRISNPGFGSNTQVA